MDRNPEQKLKAALKSKGEKNTSSLSSPYWKKDTNPKNSLKKGLEPLRRHKKGCEPLKKPLTRDRNP